MTVSAPSASTNTPTSAATTGSTGLTGDFNTFLKLLTTQLQNQDPLNPQDATQFTAQLATFSMLDQLIGIQAGIGRIETLLKDATVTVPSVTPQAASAK